MARYFETIFLYLLFSLIVILFIYNWKTFSSLAHKLTKKLALVGILIFVLSFLLRQFAIPHIHHVFYDEFDAYNIAQNLFYHNICAPTLAGDKLHPEIFGQHFRPGGYHLLLNLAFRFLGESKNTAFQLNVLLGSLSVLLVFWISYLLFNNISIGIFSSIIFGLLPAHLRYSGSGSSDISSLTFITLAIFLIVLYLRIKAKSLLYLSMIVAIFSSYIKPENIIICFFFILLIAIRGKKIGLKNNEINGIIIYSLLLLMPLLARIPSMVRIEQINSNGSFWSSKNLLINFIPNLSYLIDYRYHCAFSTLLFLLGNIVLFFKQRSRWLALSVWFLFFYLVSAAYFKGNFYYSDSDRYFLIAAVSFSISAGYGIYCLLQLKLHSLAKILFSFFLFLSVVVNSIFATKNITDYTLNRDAYAEYLFVKRTAKDLPQEQYILCYSPSYIISVINKKALKLEYFAKIEPPEKIVLFKGYWWHTLKDKSAYFGEVFDKLYRSEIIAEKEINNETKYGFYLLTRK